MSSSRKGLSKKHFYPIVGAVAFLLITVSAFAVHMLIQDDGSGRQKQLQMVTLLVPPPPKVEEKPPEPEEPEEKIETPEEEKLADEQEDSSQDLPPSEELGLDADAGLGSDGFGLKAKKGGQSLIGGNGDSLYGWYASLISSDLQKLANDIIQQEGGIPTGQWQKVRFELKLDVFGNIQGFFLLSSSGNEKIDKAVNEALRRKNQFEPPPPGMPKVLKVDVILQG